MNINTRVCFFLVALVLVVSPAMAQKPSIAVAAFCNETLAGWWRSGTTGQELAAMLAKQLASSGKFKVVDRSKVAPAADGVASTRRMTAKTAAQIAKATGASYLVQSCVSSYEDNGPAAHGGPLSAGTAGGNADAYVAVDVRVVDLSTGSVAFSRTIEARSSTGGAYHGGSGATLGQTAVTKALQACIVQISDFLGTGQYPAKAAGHHKGKKSNR